VLDDREGMAEARRLRALAATLEARHAGGRRISADAEVSEGSI